MMRAKEVVRKPETKPVMNVKIAVIVCSIPELIDMDLQRSLTLSGH